MQELYSTLFPTTSTFLGALGLTADPLRTVVLDHGLDGLLWMIREDSAFVSAHRLEVVRETLQLD